MIDHNAHALEGGIAQRVEYVFPRWIDFVFMAFLADKAIDLLVVGLGGFVDQNWKPAIWNGHIELLTLIAVTWVRGWFGRVVFMTA